MSFFVAVVDRISRNVIAWSKGRAARSPDLVSRFVLRRPGLRPANLLRLFLFLAGLGSCPAQTYLFTTLAGVPGISGDVDGPGGSSNFRGPRGLAVDGGGNVIVADTLNHTIRKITPEGAVSTLAGAPGQKGSADGVGFAARFDTPTSVAADPAGNLYVADSGNRTVRKISSANVVTTIAGKPNTLSLTQVDGAGSSALFAIPSGLAVDPQGAVLVTDLHTIRRVTANGVVATIAGMWELAPYVFNHPISSGTTDGVGQAARFNLPAGVAIDRGGVVMVADTENHLIRKI